MFLVGMPIAIFLFTFHYVSIKSTDKTTENTEGNIFTFHYVSIKSVLHKVVCSGIIRFTFHYVSIKSYIIRDREGGNTNLHSTMYLLNPGTAETIKIIYLIYIPLCIY